MSTPQELIAEARDLQQEVTRVTVLRDGTDTGSHLIERLADALQAAEAKLDEIQSLPSWYNRATGEGGFDMDGAEWSEIQRIIRGVPVLGVFQGNRDTEHQETT